jgi:hypothetical protein
VSVTLFNPPPGWPAPPRDWTPPEGWTPDPTWPPPPPGWLLWVPAQPRGWQPGEPVFNRPASRPRSDGVRIFLTCAIVLIPLALVAALAVMATEALDPAQFSTRAEYDQATQDVFDVIRAVVLAIYLVTYAIPARKVGFRWTDTFFQLIPVYGIIWQFRVVHRLVYLPHIDWTPRPEAVGSGRWV